ncbi:hypothetical protein U1Q18_004235, partial [Sarracenia purpurea var. burkii]
MDWLIVEIYDTTTFATEKLGFWGGSSTIGEEDSHEVGEDGNKNHKRRRPFCGSFDLILSSPTI